MDRTTLKQALLDERLSAYARLRGGYPIPLAGATYWLILAFLGSRITGETWAIAAFVGGGAIFPLAVLYAKLLKNDFMRDESAIGGILPPIFIGMLLFWPSAVAALWTAPDLTPLILAIGMSIHWPMIGWTYARTLLFSAHAVVRAAVVFAVWMLVPERQFVAIPLFVAAIYFITVAVILIDSDMVRRRLEKAT